MRYNVRFSNRGSKDYDKVKRSPLIKKANKILDILENDPYSPPFEKLVDNLKGKYSRRLNIQHRIVYEIRESERVVVILSMWTHYE